MPLERGKIGLLRLINISTLPEDVIICNWCDPPKCALPHAKSRHRFEGIITCSWGWGEAPLELAIENISGG